MNARNDFALVPSPAGALEKAQPTGKRVLSGMVSDTLALANQTRPFRIVCVDDEYWRLEIVEFVVSTYFKGVILQSFRDAEEAWQELSRTAPDLLITDDIMGKLNGDQLVRRLADRKVAYPIIVINAFGPSWNQLVSDFATQGLHITLLSAPYTLLSAPYDVETLVMALESGLQISRDTVEKPVEIRTNPRNKRTLRIIQVNDEQCVLDSFTAIIRLCFPDATLLSFDNATDALEALSQAEPDLLITDDTMPVMRGSELCQHLLDRKVSYPIIVNSAWDPTKQWVSDLAGKGPSIFFLPLPFTPESLCKVLEAAGLQIPLNKIKKSVEIAQQTSSARPPKIVVVYDEFGRGVSIEWAFRCHFNNAELHFFEDSREAAEALSGATASRITPDLLITFDRMAFISGVDIVQRVARNAETYPIIVLSGWNGPQTKTWVNECASRGLNIKFLSFPFEVPDFLKVVALSLNIPVPNLEKGESPFAPVETPVVIPPQQPNKRQPRIVSMDAEPYVVDALNRTRPFRIIHHDDEGWLLELIGEAIAQGFKNVVLKNFQDGNEAYAALQRAEPDLFITDLFAGNVPDRTQSSWKSGWMLLDLLQEKKVSYPILVLSGQLEGNQNDNQFVANRWPDLKISCLQKGISCTLDKLYSELDKHIGAKPREKRP